MRTDEKSCMVVVLCIGRDDENVRKVEDFDNSSIFLVNRPRMDVRRAHYAFIGQCLPSGRELSSPSFEKEELSGIFVQCWEFKVWEFGLSPSWQP